MGSRNTFKRKEMKYLMTKDQKDAFVKQIREYVIADEYEKYTISNIYLDTPDNRLIRKSIEKPVYKEKMRVRSYGRADSNSKIFVELKKKYNGIVYKRRVSMTVEEAKKFIEGESNSNSQIEAEIDYFMDFYEGIRPSMFIAYDREAYKGSDDNQLRITFDDNILWRDNDLSLTKKIYGNSLLNDDQVLMEIKCGDAMPLWLTKALSENHIYKTSFSKYGKAYMSQQNMEDRKCLSC